MKAMTVGDLKRHFSAVLDDVRRGESIVIEYGRSHKEVAVLVPFQDYEKGEVHRPLGLLSGRGSVRFTADFAISDEELLGT